MIHSNQNTNHGIVLRPCRLAILSLVIALSTIACDRNKIEKLQGYVQGTTYHISYWSEAPVDDSQVRQAIDEEFAAIDRSVSNYRNDSVIENFNAAQTTDPFTVGKEIVDLVKVAGDNHRISEGCYDLTVKPLFLLWGFHDEAPHVPDDQAIKDTLAQIGMDKLEISGESQLRKRQADIKVDLSSIAQGYSVERVSQVLERFGIKNYLVEIGGELKTNGHKPDQSVWRIAVEKPLPGEQKMQKIIDMPKDLPYAVMTSGTYHHFFDSQGKRYSHIIDARSGRPVEHDLVSVTVIHPDPVVADAWSTTLLCVGQEQGLKAADAAKISALFIQQRNNEFIETKSASLLAQHAFTLH